MPSVSEELEIHSLAFGGNAVARRGSGKVCFLYDALPGEKVRAEILEEKKNYSYGKITEILKESSGRIVPFCSSECPGCPYRMMEYSLELEWKHKQLLAFVERLKKMKVKEILPPVGAESRTSWRNKVSFHLSKDTLCYVGRDNHTAIPVIACPIARQEINAFLQDDMWRKNLEKNAEKITFRWTQKDGVHFFTDKSKRKMILTEDLGQYGLFQVEMHSFFQINIVMAQKLIGKFLLLARSCGAEYLLELYCGCGIFSILAAEKYQMTACGIELDPASIRLAKENARLHSVENLCTFHAGDAGKMMNSLFGKKRLPRQSLLLVDPPRTGLAPNALKMLLDAEAGFVIYISCGPAALMRDLDLLAEKYQTEQ
ncbi:MAG: class I SAM-dependent RNA methyltransferase, partial [Lentisphaeria bacterium]|nr:class I SAM-dependent RNA methyltransferase [Lentisphaeria bacterium]